MSSPVAADLSGDLAPATSVRWRLIGLLMAISFLNHFNRISMSVAGKELIRQKVYSEETMGWIYSSLLYAYTLFMTPGGWLSDQKGGRFALSLVGLGAGTCAIFTGVSLGAWQGGAALFFSLILVRALMGMCIAPIYPGSGSIVARWLPFRQRASAMALITGAAPLGIAATYVFYPNIIKRLGLSNSFYFLGTVTIALALVWMWYSRRKPTEHSGANVAERLWIESNQTAPESETPTSPTSSDVAQTSGWRCLLRNRSLWLITLSYGTLGYMEYVQFYWADYFFTDVLGYTGNKALIASVAPYLLMCLTMPLGGWLSDRLMPIVGYRRSRALIAGLGLVGSAVALGAATCLNSSTHSTVIVVGFALSLGFIGLSEGPSWATAIDLGRHRGGTSAGIFNTGGNGIGALGPIVTPAFKTWLVEHRGLDAVSGWNWSLRLGCLICIVGALLWFWINPAEKRDE